MDADGGPWIFRQSFGNWFAVISKSEPVEKATFSSVGWNVYFGKGSRRQLAVSLVLCILLNCRMPDWFAYANWIARSRYMFLAVQLWRLNQLVDSMDACSPKLRFFPWISADVASKLLTVTSIRHFIHSTTSDFTSRNTIALNSTESGSGSSGRNCGWILVELQLWLAVEVWLSIGKCFTQLDTARPGGGKKKAIRTRSNSAECVCVSGLLCVEDGVLLGNEVVKISEKRRRRAGTALERQLKGSCRRADDCSFFRRSSGIELDILPAWRRSSRVIEC